MWDRRRAVDATGRRRQGTSAAGFGERGTLQASLPSRPPTGKTGSAPSTGPNAASTAPTPPTARSMAPLPPSPTSSLFRSSSRRQQQLRQRQQRQHHRRLVLYSPPANSSSQFHSSHPPLDHSLSAFGITTDITQKYRIHRGKAVPQSLYPEDPYLSHRDHYSSSASSPDLRPPPRNPRRLQQLRYHTAIAPTRSSSRYSSDVTDSEDDASPTTIRRGAAALDMARPLSIQPVSPPSSPEIASWRKNSHADSVSPIDEDVSDASLEDFVQAIKGARRDANPPADPPRSSQIPIKQHDLPSLPRDDAPRALGMEQPPSLRKEASQRKPVGKHGAQRRPPSPQERPAPGKQTSRMAQQGIIPERDSSFGLRSKNERQPMPMANRPPWHGASGREKQVNPLRDDPNVAPLDLPGKGDRRGTKGESNFRARLSHIGPPRVDGTNSAASAMRKLISSRTHKKANSLATQSPRAQYAMDSGRSTPDTYPSPPYQNQSRMTFASPSPQHSPGQSVTIRRKPPPSAHVDRDSNHAHPLASSPVNEDEIPKPPTPESPVAQQPPPRADTSAQPSSRFSITTYATTDAGTPAPTSIENSPAIGVDSPGSMSSRGRPVPKNEHLRSVSDMPFAARRPLAAMQELPSSDDILKDSTNTDKSVKAPRRSSLSSLTKPLPPAPPEVSAGDRVAHLNAQLEGLANRRLNINRCVKQMTELIPMDNLLASSEVQKKRELERKKVDSLKAELAEIQREEHELGLMLHRAYKRQNKEAEYEPTTLWVRRVAG